MQYSIVNLSEVSNSRRYRLDSEYWLPKFLKYNFVKSKLKIADILLEKNIKNIKKSLNKDDFDYLEISNTSNDLDYTTVHINFNNIPERATYILKNNDICISTVRPNRNAVAYIKNIHNKRIIGTSGFCVLRTNNEKIKSEFLLILTKTNHFIDYLVRENTATMYPAVTNEDILEYSLPIIKEEFQNKIADLVNEAYKLREQSKDLYKQAQDILEEELNFKNWQPKNKKTSIKKLSEVKDASNTFRFDAEYFQPKYEDIINKIKSYKHGYKPLCEIAEENKTKYTKKEINKYVEIGSINVSDGSYIYNLIELNNLPHNARIKLNKDDLIISTVRPYRGAIAIIKKDGLVGSSAFCIFKSSKIIKQEVLFVFLRLKAILDLTLKFNTGTSYPVITNDNVKSLLVPNIPAHIQEKISLLIESSFNAKNRAKKLLDIAKKGVELAIEKDEITATSWINQALKV